MDDIPGSAYLQMWDLYDDGTLSPIEGLIFQVWNFNTIAIPSGMWITVFRDKRGNWLVPCPGFRFGVC